MPKHRRITVDDDNYLVFRDSTGTLYARGLNGEDYDIYFMDKPDVNVFRERS